MECETEHRYWGQWENTEKKLPDHRPQHVHGERRNKDAQKTPAIQGSTVGKPLKNPTVQGKSISRTWHTKRKASGLLNEQTSWSFTAIKELFQRQSCHLSQASVQILSQWTGKASANGPHSANSVHEHQHGYFCLSVLRQKWAKEIIESTQDLWKNFRKLSSFPQFGGVEKPSFVSQLNFETGEVKEVRILLNIPEGSRQLDLISACSSNFVHIS